MTKSWTLLHPEDDVLIALRDISAGTPIVNDIVASADISSGHKIARHAVKAGDPVLRYKQIIINRDWHSQHYDRLEKLLRVPVPVIGVKSLQLST